MNVKPLYNNDNIITVDHYISDNGIGDINEYLHPTNKYMEDPLNYINMEDAVQMFHEHMVKKDKVYIVVDNDTDGYTSASSLFMYMKKLEPQWDITVGFHTGKQRGLQDLEIFNALFNKDINFVIIPDAGSNDREAIKELKWNGIDVLVLDHHEITESMENYGILVNNQQGDVDSHGSGCAVTFMFLKALDKAFNLKYANGYVDLVGLSIISDNMDVRTQQNRKYLHYGILHSNRIVNPLLKELIAQSQLSEKSDYSQRDIAFNIVPCINSVCRCDDMELKKKMFLGFINEDSVDIFEIVKAMKSQHSKQQRLIKDFVDERQEYI